MWRTLKNGKKRSYAPCKLCGAWLSAQAIADHWYDEHPTQWLELQRGLARLQADSEEKEKVQ